ncbi:MAG: hydrolase [Pelagibacterales bacterium MED-G40]|nr:MAG: hydrolase [Pelagibacterales bacterium MED-G40]|tara:strand:+ start:2351 stop:3148 length:798 start_codon:yes stop_codon:yes gene_type:complete
MFKVSCIQLCSNNNIKNNFEKTKYYINKAVRQNADLIITPEISSFFSLKKKELSLNVGNMRNDIYLKGIKDLSKSYRKWILIGSLVTKIKNNKFANRSVLINPKGKIHSYYDKIHMYDARLSKNEVYNESKTFVPGNKIKVAKLPWGKLGMSICYDLRFPKMYRTMSKQGALFLSIPSAFTETTGKKHWHILLKARAIENFCYIFAPAQSGKHFNGRRTYGHSIIISPDGKTIKELKKKEGIISANIDPSFSKILRKKIPSLYRE